MKTRKAIRTAIHSLPILCLLLHVPSAVAEDDGKDPAFERTMLASETFKNATVNPLVEIDTSEKALNTPKHAPLSKAQTEQAKSKAQEVFTLLMEGPLPDLSYEMRDKGPHHFWGRQGRLGVGFTFDGHGDLHSFSIKSIPDVNELNPHFPARKKMLGSDFAELYREVFDQEPQGVLKSMPTRSEWTPKSPMDSYLFQGSISHSEGRRGESAHWTGFRGVTPKHLGELTKHVENTPTKITNEEAIAITFKAARELSIPIVSRPPVSVSKGYHSVPTPKNPYTVRRAKNRPDIDGYKPIYGIRVHFRSWSGTFGEPVIQLESFVDPQTGDVLYITPTG